jgi:hypothetical protein
MFLLLVVVVVVQVATPCRVARVVQVVVAARLWRLTIH